jgi:hypothetical protein
MWLPPKHERTHHISVSVHEWTTGENKAGQLVFSTRQWSRGVFNCQSVEEVYVVAFKSTVDLT